MNAIKYTQRTYDKLNAVPRFAQCFPHLMKQLARGHVWAWEDNGVTSELTKEQIEYIEKLEESLSEYEVTVYAVLNNRMRVNWHMVEMTCYLYTSNEGNDISAAGPDAFYAIANVYNKTWNFAESGDVVITSCAAGGPKRLRAAPMPDLIEIY